MASKSFKPFWGRKSYCIITGASQGIGRQIAIDFARNVADQSGFLLLARNIDNLNETKNLMESVNPNVNVFAHVLNLSEPIGIEIHKLIALSLTVFAEEPQGYELAMVVHNAGSLGDITELAVEMRNIEKINTYLTLNLSSVILLTSEFLKIFDVDTEKTEVAFVNITSLGAVQAIASMGYYCIGKAAREMYFKVLQTENKQFTVLSYSPGPVLTDMTDHIIENIRCEDNKQMFVEMKKDSKLLTTEKTVGRLVDILKRRDFENGGRKDYFDNDA